MRIDPRHRRLPRTPAAVGERSACDFELFALDRNDDLPHLGDDATPHNDPLDRRGLVADQPLLVEHDVDVDEVR